MKINDSQLRFFTTVASTKLRVEGLTLEFSKITGSASGRRYFRISSPATPLTLIAVVGTDPAENRAFIDIATTLGAAGLPLPEIIASAPELLCYVTSDNGSRSLYDLISASRKASATGELAPDVLNLCCQSLRELARFQIVGAEKVDPAVLYPVKEVTRQAVMWDLNYFKYCFLKPLLDCEIDEAALDRDFEHLASMVTSPDNLMGLQYRDFQSRNILVGDDDELTLIDFQSARHGMMLYDAASFIWQARAAFTPAERETLLEAYRSQLKLNSSQLQPQYLTATTFRQLQTLGAYGFRGLAQGKAKFVTSIPSSLANIAERIAAGELGDYPAIAQAIIRAQEIWLEKYCPNQACGSPCGATRGAGLTVTVTSFSYTNGSYPLDPTGNGGGFAFDCRGMANPGRYAEFKQLTGLDRPVRDFLEARDECPGFVDKALAIVMPSVKNYLERGFSSLSVGFGCTGGQHRSVYCADLFARKLHELQPEVKVVLTHRQLNLPAEWMQ